MASIRTKDLPAMLKSLSTSAEDAGMQKNQFSSKTALRIIRNILKRLYTTQLQRKVSSL